MFNGKLVSCKAAIDRVYGDANLEVNIEEAVRWPSSLYASGFILVILFY